MVDWIEELMELMREEEREEDELLPDWTAGLGDPVLPQEKSGGAEDTERAAETETETKGPLAGTETERPQSGAEAGAAVRSAETDAWDDPDSMPDMGRMEVGPERPNKPENDGENGHSGVLNSGIWLDGTTGRRTADSASDDCGQDEAVGLGPEAALAGLARALGGSGDVLPEMVQRVRTEHTAGAGRPDGTAPEITGWAPVGFEGAKTFAELDKAVRAETDSGVEWLYRQTARAEWQTAPAAGAVGAVRLVETGSGPAAALTVEELDRAVRRDSRRYDGEMSIY